MRLKLFLCLLPFTFLNGSFTPIGEGKSSKGINYQVRPDYASNSIEDQIADKMRVLEDLSKHEQELRLRLVVSHTSHCRKVDSLTALINNITP